MCFLGLFWVKLCNFFQNGSRRLVRKTPATRRLSHAYHRNLDRRVRSVHRRPGQRQGHGPPQPGVGRLGFPAHGRRVRERVRSAAQVRDPASGPVRAAASANHAGSVRHGRAQPLGRERRPLREGRRTPRRVRHRVRGPVRRHQRAGCHPHVARAERPGPAVRPTTGRELARVRGWQLLPGRRGWLDAAQLVQDHSDQFGLDRLLRRSRRAGRPSVARRHIANRSIQRGVWAREKTQRVRLSAPSSAAKGLIA